MQVTQKSEHDGGIFDVEWINMGSASDAEVAKMASNLRFRDIFVSTDWNITEFPENSTSAYLEQFGSPLLHIGCHVILISSITPESVETLLNYESHMLLQHPDHNGFGWNTRVLDSDTQKGRRSPCPFTILDGNVHRIALVLDMQVCGICSYQGHGLSTWHFHRRLLQPLNFQSVKNLSSPTAA